MSVFDAKIKDGCSVGLRVVMLDENGEQISDTESEWFGFDREHANNLSIAFVDASGAVIKKVAELKAGKSGRSSGSQRDGR